MEPRTIRIPAGELDDQFRRILELVGFNPQGASVCASVFTSNSLDGVYSHGVNRFPKFVEYIRKGWIDPSARSRLLQGTQTWEQWDGQCGPGILNALHATDRALQLASRSGTGLVTLARTNHWMRGGYYGWKAAREGFFFIGWSNTIANMAAWGSGENRLGNNPLVLAIPYGDEAIVLDMAMSQFSYGALELYRYSGKELPVPGGFDAEGALSRDPAAIISAHRPIPMGFWKGAGLSLVLDILAATLSGGLGVREITAQGIEHNLSQVFLALDTRILRDPEGTAEQIRSLLQDYSDSPPLAGKGPIRYPGERVLQTRKEHTLNGIPVDHRVWKQILALGSTDGPEASEAGRIFI